MWRRKLTASIVKCNSSPCSSQAAARTVRSKRRVLGLRRREGCEVVRPGSSAAAASRAARSSGFGHHSARRASKAERHSSAGGSGSGRRDATRRSGALKSSCRLLGPEDGDVVRQSCVERLAARSGGGPPSARTLATWPVACTPVSVRPAHREPAPGAGRRASSASRSTASIVRSSGWRAQPRKPLPSYSSVSFRVFSGTGAQSKLAVMASTERKYDLYGPEFRADPHASSRRCASTILFCGSPASTARLRSGSSPGTTTSPLCSSTTSGSCVIPGSP